MPRGNRIRAKSVMILIASKELQNPILTLLACQDEHEECLHHLVYTLRSDDLPSRSNLTLECDHKHGDDGPHKYRSPYRKTHPPV